MQSIGESKSQSHSEVTRYAAAKKAEAAAAKKAEAEREKVRQAEKAKQTEREKAKQAEKAKTDKVKELVKSGAKSSKTPIEKRVVKETIHKSYLKSENSTKKENTGELSATKKTVPAPRLSVKTISEKPETTSAASSKVTSSAPAIPPRTTSAGSVAPPVPTRTTSAGLVAPPVPPRKVSASLAAPPATYSKTIPSEFAYESFPKRGGIPPSAPPLSAEASAATYSKTIPPELQYKSFPKRGGIPASAPPLSAEASAATYSKTIPSEFAYESFPKRGGLTPSAPPLSAEASAATYSKTIPPELQYKSFPKRGGLTPSAPPVGAEAATTRDTLKIVPPAPPQSELMDREAERQAHHQMLASQDGIVASQVTIDKQKSLETTQNISLAKKTFNEIQDKKKYIDNLSKQKQDIESQAKHYVPTSESKYNLDLQAHNLQKKINAIAHEKQELTKKHLVIGAKLKKMHDTNQVHGTEEEKKICSQYSELLKTTKQVQDLTKIINSKKSTANEIASAQQNKKLLEEGTCKDQKKNLQKSFKSYAGVQKSQSIETTIKDAMIYDIKTNHHIADLNIKIQATRDYIAKNVQPAKNLEQQDSGFVKQTSKSAKNIQKAKIMQRDCITEKWHASNQKVLKLKDTKYEITKEQESCDIKIKKLEADKKALKDDKIVYEQESYLQRSVLAKKDSEIKAHDVEIKILSDKKFYLQGQQEKINTMVISEENNLTDITVELNDIL